MTLAKEHMFNARTWHQPVRDLPGRRHRRGAPERGENRPAHLLRSLRD